MGQKSSCGEPRTRKCNALDTPVGGSYSWRDLDWPHKSILVFSAHFVLTRAQKRLVLICGASLDPARSNDHRRVCPGRYKFVSEPTLAVTWMFVDRCAVMLFMTFVTRRGTRHGTCTGLHAQTYVPRGNVPVAQRARRFL